MDRNGNEKTKNKVDLKITNSASTTAAAVTATPSAVATATPDISAEYIFPDSNSEYLAKSDLKGLSQSKIRLAINEIYARRGAKFESASNKKYFESKSWYKATCSQSEAEKKFNKYEKKNVDLLVEYEESKGWR